MYRIHCYQKTSSTHPWRVVLEELRTYKKIEQIDMRSKEEVINKIREYKNMFGENCGVSEYTLFGYPKILSTRMNKDGKLAKI